MTRALPILAVCLCASIAATAQGISGVTRRTPMVQKQAPARQFFDSAGISVSGASGNASAAAGTGTAVVTPQARPSLLPPVASRIPPARPATPLILQAQGRTVATNSLSPKTQPQPASRHARP